MSNNSNTQIKLMNQISQQSTQQQQDQANIPQQQQQQQQPKPNNQLPPHLYRPSLTDRMISPQSQIILTQPKSNQNSNNSFIQHAIYTSPKPISNNNSNLQASFNPVQLQNNINETSQQQQQVQQRNNIANGKSQDQFQVITVASRNISPNQSMVNIKQRFYSPTPQIAGKQLNESGINSGEQNNRIIPNTVRGVYGQNGGVKQVIVQQQQPLLQQQQQQSHLISYNSASKLTTLNTDRLPNNNNQGLSQQPSLRNVQLLPQSSSQRRVHSPNSNQTLDNIIKPIQNNQQYQQFIVNQQNGNLNGINSQQQVIPKAINHIRSQTSTSQQPIVQINSSPQRKIVVQYHPVINNNNNLNNSSTSQSVIQSNNNNNNKIENLTGSNTGQQDLAKSNQANVITINQQSKKYILTNLIHSSNASNKIELNHSNNNSSQPNAIITTLMNNPLNENKQKQLKNIDQNHLSSEAKKLYDMIGKYNNVVNENRENQIPSENNRENNHIQQQSLRINNYPINQTNLQNNHPERFTFGGSRENSKHIQPIIYQQSYQTSRIISQSIPSPTSVILNSHNNNNDSVIQNSIIVNQMSPMRITQSLESRKRIDSQKKSIHSSRSSSVEENRNNLSIVIEVGDKQGYRRIIEGSPVRSQSPAVLQSNSQPIIQNSPTVRRTQYFKKGNKLLTLEEVMEEKSRSQHEYVDQSKYTSQVRLIDDNPYSRNTISPLKNDELIEEKDEIIDDSQQQYKSNNNNKMENIKVYSTNNSSNSNNNNQYSTISTNKNQYNTTKEQAEFEKEKLEIQQKQELLLKLQREKLELQRSLVQQSERKSLMEQDFQRENQQRENQMKEQFELKQKMQLEAFEKMQQEQIQFQDNLLKETQNKQLNEAQLLKESQIREQELKEKYERQQQEFMKKLQNDQLEFQRNLLKEQQERKQKIEEEQSKENQIKEQQLKEQIQRYQLEMEQQQKRQEEERLRLESEQNKIRQQAEDLEKMKQKIEEEKRKEWELKLNSEQQKQYELITQQHMQKLEQQQQLQQQKEQQFTSQIEATQQQFAKLLETQQNITAEERKQFKEAYQLQQQELHKVQQAQIEQQKIFAEQLQHTVEQHQKQLEQLKLEQENQTKDLKEMLLNQSRQSAYNNNNNHNDSIISNEQNEIFLKKQLDQALSIERQKQEQKEKEFKYMQEQQQLLLQRQSEQLEQLKQKQLQHEEQERLILQQKQELEQQINDLRSQNESHQGRDYDTLNSDKIEMEVSNHHEEHDYQLTRQNRSENSKERCIDIPQEEFEQDEQNNYDNDRNHDHQETIKPNSKSPKRIQEVAELYKDLEDQGFVITEQNWQTQKNQHQPQQQKSQQKQVYQTQDTEEEVHKQYQIQQQLPQQNERIENAQQYQQQQGNGNSQLRQTDKEEDEDDDEHEKYENAHERQDDDYEETYSVDVEEQEQQQQQRQQPKSNQRNQPQNQIPQKNFAKNQKLANQLDQIELEIQRLQLEEQQQYNEQREHEQRQQQQQYQMTLNKNKQQQQKQNKNQQRQQNGVVGVVEEHEDEYNSTNHYSSKKNVKNGQVIYANKNDKQSQKVFRNNNHNLKQQTYVPGQRLYEYALEKTKRNKELQKQSQIEKSQKELEKCTFNPRLVSTNKQFEDFETRNSKWQKQKELNIDQRGNFEKEKEVRECTFHPEFYSPNRYSQYCNPQFIYERQMEWKKQVEAQIHYQKECNENLIKEKSNEIHTLSRLKRSTVLSNNNHQMNSEYEVLPQVSYSARLNKILYSAKNRNSTNFNDDLQQQSIEQNSYQIPSQFNQNQVFTFHPQSQQSQQQQQYRQQDYQTIQNSNGDLANSNINNNVMKSQINNIDGAFELVGHLQGIMKQSNYCDSNIELEQMLQYQNKQQNKSQMGFNSNDKRNNISSSKKEQSRSQQGSEFYIAHNIAKEEQKQKELDRLKEELAQNKAIIVTQHPILAEKKEYAEVIGNVSVQKNKYVLAWQVDPQMNQNNQQQYYANFSFDNQQNQNQLLDQYQNVQINEQHDLQEEEEEEQLMPEDLQQQQQQLQNIHIIQHHQEMIQQQQQQQQQQGQMSHNSTPSHNINNNQFIKAPFTYASQPIPNNEVERRTQISKTSHDEQEQHVNPHDDDEDDQIHSMPNRQTENYERAIDNIGDTENSEVI